MFINLITNADANAGVYFIFDYRQNQFADL